MFIASTRGLDPTLFQRDHEQQFTSVVIENALALEEANRIINLREGYDPEAEAESIAQEMQEEGGEIQQAYESILENLGGDDSFIKQRLIGPLMGGGESEVSDEDYQTAIEKQSEAATTLVDYTCGYQGYMRENLARAYGHGDEPTPEDDEAVQEEAWMATWKKLHGILFNTEGTLLAEVALFFDRLVKERFGKEYRAMETDRGPVVSQDVSARTFYIVMEKHLHRAIIGANRDDWTGYE
jgi:hypothetical protein